MITDISNIKKSLYAYQDEYRANISKRYFKTGPKEYGEGDIFIGVRVPIIRKIANQFQDIGFIELEELIYSEIHEERLLALIILVKKFNNKKVDLKKRVFDFYLKNIDQVNNWDLVDSSAKQIIGPYIYNNNKLLKTLINLAHSNNLWHRRIAIIASHYFIKNGIYDITLDLATLLLKDKEDLIQKAVGWMLREIGLKDMEIEKAYLDKHAAYMPRTMLRYSIEKFDNKLKKYYMKIKKHKNDK